MQSGDRQAMQLTPRTGRWFESFVYNPFTKAKTFNANNGTVNYANHTKGESKKRKQMAKRSRRINRK